MQLFEIIKIQRGEIMAKEWILNGAMNRFQLHFKRNVGAVSEAIRKCSANTVALKDISVYVIHEKNTDIMG